MNDDPRVEQLLEELLESGGTPEDVCRHCPELLARVRAGWKLLRALDAEVKALFPETPHGEQRAPVAPGPAESAGLPQVAGYEVKSMLGRGGMGVVFKARHHKLNRIVALKMLLAGPYAGPEESARFRREAEAVAALKHPNIVQVYDAGDVGGRPYFTMEYIEAGTLAQRLAGNPMAPRKAAELVATLATAVQFAHQSGYIHRDLKPPNILLTADGTPKITDFGLAHWMGAGSALTLNGARLGTPTYMAPEQASGSLGAVGPATDIYSLGAMLYEMLTGKPPLEGKSPTETIQKVIAEEPTPPSRWNAKVPRDLDTICLKCLHKNPARRYASAQDLADDLNRFLDGKPVLARPIGALERTVKWARRRPALAMFLALLVLALGGGIAAGIVLWQQASEQSRQTEQRRDRARQAIEARIDQAYEAGRAECWKEVNRIIDNTKIHLPEADSAELSQRLTEVKRHSQFVQNLEFIRLHSELLVFDKISVPQTSYMEQHEEFARVFAQSPFDVGAPAHETAQRVRAFPFAPLVVAALDDWALAAYMTGNTSLHEQLLSIARLADPDPHWRDRLRSADFWKNRLGLVFLCNEVPVTPKPPGASQLAIAAALLRQADISVHASSMLEKASDSNASDFWLHYVQANWLSGADRYHAIEPYRIADALRPGHAWIQARLAACLTTTNKIDDGIRTYRRALADDPKNGQVRHGLVLALHFAGHTEEAQAECRSALGADPQDPWAAISLGTLLSLRKDKEAAVGPLRQACQSLADGASRRSGEAAVLEKSGDMKEALAAYRDAAAMAKCSVLGRRVLARTLTELGRHDEAARELEGTVREIDASAAFRTEDFKRRYADIQMALIESLSASGRFADASAAARKTLRTAGLDPMDRVTVERNVEITDKLGAITADLPSYLSGAKRPPDRETHLLLAEWLLRNKRFTAGSARCYEAAFAAWPGNEFGQHRYHAVRAAALAGRGLGDDAAELTETEKTALRTLTKKWLVDECREVAREVEQGKSNALQRVKLINDWEKEPDLACVRDKQHLTNLPEREQIEWRALWVEVRRLVSDAPEIYRIPKGLAKVPNLPKELHKALTGAHPHVDKKEWAQAAGIYETLLKSQPTRKGGVDFSEFYFECAAVQLLADNRAGYRRTCSFMLDSARRQGLRQFLIARACTLAADEEIDVILATELTTGELKPARTFWSLTQQGALCYRMKQYKEAVAFFEESLRLEKRPGAAVLNWLWLAMAHHQMGQNKEARARLEQAQAWLDTLGSEYQPTREATDNLHRHNWLEALILRREAESLLLPTGK